MKFLEKIPKRLRGGGCEIILDKTPRRSRGIDGGKILLEKASSHQRSGQIILKNTNRGLQGDRGEVILEKASNHLSSDRNEVF